MVVFGFDHELYRFFSHFLSHFVYPAIEQVAGVRIFRIIGYALFNQVFQFVQKPFG